MGQAVVNMAVSFFGGFTWIDTMGGWVDPDNKRVVRECGQTLVIVSEHKDQDAAKGLAEILAKTIRDAFFQKCVVLTITEVNSRFVYE